MSTFTDYNDISSTYDAARRHQGAQYYPGLITSLTRKPAHLLDIHLLDMGCGTGIHASYLLEQGLGRATLFDANPGMLTKARAKLEKFGDRVKIDENKLPNLPYENEMFDVVMSNQVFHHLIDINNAKDRSVIRKTMEETYRVLKPNGCAIIQLTGVFQMKHGHWWTKLAPRMLEKYVKRLMTTDEFLTILRDAGFKNVGVLIDPVELCYPEEWYFRADGFLDPTWRKTDSFTESVSEEELETITREVERMKKEGSLVDYMLKADEMRKHVGQYTIFHAKKE